MTTAACRSDAALAAALRGEAIPSESRPQPETADGRYQAFLQSIRVEGFRGAGPAATLEISPGPGLTLVVGRNGSGKSSSHPSEDDPNFVRDCADRVGARSQFGSDLSRERVRSTGRGRRMEDLASEEQEPAGPFGRQTALDPCRLPTNEVIRTLEPELFEPPRGP
jgi:hypothetical protein